MTFVNISAYRFVELPDAEALRQAIFDVCEQQQLRGTVLLSKADGINLNLVGSRDAINQFLAFIQADARFTEMPIKESLSTQLSFKRLKVKVKPEIITIKQPDINPVKHTVPYIAPKELKKWFDEGREFTLIDTRNHYECAYGTFENAIELRIENFTDFKQASQQLPADLKQKPTVIVCTGGVRCEKAGPVLTAEGFQEVYQLHGGILQYFADCGGSHYRGDCFVFDDRIAVNSQLQETM
jgi:UPF0176 protein